MTTGHRIILTKSSLVLLILIIKCNSQPCKISEYFPSSTCVNVMDSSALDTIDEYFNGLSKLRIGETCNFDEHVTLFTISLAERKNHELRLKNIEIIKNGGRRFCDIRQFVICNPKSAKCDCGKPLFFEPRTGKCEIRRPDDYCDKNLEIQRIVENPRNVRITEQSLRAKADELEETCYGHQARCLIEDKFHGGIEFFCGCDNQKMNVELNCTEELTAFLNKVNVIGYPIDVEYTEQVRLFGELNKKAIEFENLFKLENGADCDTASETIAQRNVRIIRNLDFWDVFRMVAADYRFLINSMTIMLAKGQQLCSLNLRRPSILEDTDTPSLPHLKCNPTTRKCFSPTVNEHITDYMERLKPFETLKAGSLCFSDIIQHPLNISSNFNDLLIVGLETFWAWDTHFCDRKDGFICQIANETNDRMGRCVQADSTSNSQSLSRNNFQIFYPLFIHILPHIIWLSISIVS